MFVAASLLTFVLCFSLFGVVRHIRVDFYQGQALSSWKRAIEKREEKRREINPEKVEEELKTTKME